MKQLHLPSTLPSGHDRTATPLQSVSGDNPLRIGPTRRIIPSDLINEPPRERLLIGLVAGAALLLCLALLAGWLIPAVGFGNIHPWAAAVTGFFLVGCICFIAWAALGLVVHICTGRMLWGAAGLWGLAIKWFLPVMELLARAARISPEEVRRGFIQVNNQFTIRRGFRYEADRILILLPHCLQRTECDIRLTSSPEGCKRCGACSMAGLLALRDAYGVRLAIATGGGIARRIVAEMRPALIIAVACERDLISGIQDTYPLPVYGILNQRPEGPCRNTTVNFERVELALRALRAEHH